MIKYNLIMTAENLKADIKLKDTNFLTEIKDFEVGEWEQWEEFEFDPWESLEWYFDNEEDYEPNDFFNEYENDLKKAVEEFIPIYIEKYIKECLAYDNIDSRSYLSNISEVKYELRAYDYKGFTSEEEELLNTYDLNITGEY